MTANGGKASGYQWTRSDGAEKNVKYDRAVAELRIKDVSSLSANHCKIVVTGCIVI